MISFAGGSPNPALFPYDAVARAMADVMADLSLRTQALQYGASEGYGPLRTFIVQYLAGRGGAIGLENVLITSGSQQALALVGALYLNPGDRVVVTNPTYLGALQAFSLSEPNYVGVPVDANGIDLGALEQAFAGGAKFFYVMPDFGNPSGLTLPLHQRHKILELARVYQVPVIEDQAYDQLRLSGEPLPSLLALSRPPINDTAEPGIIYAGTFSKSLAPGLRVGWIVAPRAVVTKLVSIKQAFDLHTPTLNQILVHRVVGSLLASHGETLRASYRAQRDAMLRALTQYMPGGTRWNEPEGGMFVWLTLPDGLNAAELQLRAAQEERVLFVPGAPFFTDGSGADTARLSFSLSTPEDIDRGVQRLARATGRALAGLESTSA